MRLFEIINLSPNTVKYAEIKYSNQYDNKDWGKKRKTEKKDVIVRDIKTGTIYGRRTVVQRA